MIDRDSIDRIRDSTSITALIGEVVKLRRQGQSQVGLCPFHQEKTPSFVVHEERGFFHCFGCGASGDVFGFLEQHEGLSFGEAVRRLAERAGIAIDQISSRSEPRAEEDARRQRQHHYDAAAVAAAFFQRMLEEHPLGGLARAELERRHLVPSASPDPVADALLAFRVGYAPYGWDALSSHLARSGINLDVAQKLGLVLPRTGATGCFDRFRHRLVFPVLDLHGRVVAFVGRALEQPSESELSHAGQQPLGLMEAAPGTPRYIGCPESLVYRPRQLVFGLHQARQSLRADGQCVVVRGVFEVLSLHAHGIRAAVAPLGAGMTVEQALLIKRFCQRVTFLRGADSAGQRAVAAAQQTCRQAGLLVKVASLPAGVDADELLARQGAETVRQMLSAARGLLEYLIDRSLDSHFVVDDLPTRVAKVQRVAALLSGEPDALVRALVQQYADNVVARLGIAEATTFALLRSSVERELRRAERAPGANERTHAAAVSGAGRADPDAGWADPDAGQADPSGEMGREILGVLLDYPELLADAAIAEGLQRLEGDAAAGVAAARRAWDGKHGIEVDGFLSRLAPRLRAFAERRLLAPVHASVEDARAELARCLSLLG